VIAPLSVAAESATGLIGSREKMANGRLPTQEQPAVLLIETVVISSLNATALNL
jgi:hypothetical protein